MNKIMSNDYEIIVIKTCKGCGSTKARKYTDPDLIMCRDCNRLIKEDKPKHTCPICNSINAKDSAQPIRLKRMSNYDLQHYVYHQYRNDDPELTKTDTCLLEELNELSAEILRMVFRDKSTKRNLAHEIKDVKYLLYQFEKKYNLSLLIREAMLEEIKLVPEKILSAQELRRQQK